MRVGSQRRLSTKNWRFLPMGLEKTLDSPLYSKEIKPINPKGNQSWIFTGMLKLNLQHLGYLMSRVNSLEKTLILRTTEDRRRRVNRGWDGWMASSTQWTWVWANSEIGKHREACCAAVHGVMKMQTWLSNWITTTDKGLIYPGVCQNAWTFYEFIMSHLKLFPFTGN